MREIQVQTQVIKKNCTINEPKMVSFHDSLPNSYKRYFVLSWTLCIAEEQWISGFVWHRNISPELGVLSSPGTTWYPWIHIVSYVTLWDNIRNCASFCSSDSHLFKAGPSWVYVGLAVSERYQTRKTTFFCELWIYGIQSWRKKNS